MSYLVLKFLHVGSMFIATALAVGPVVILTLILRTGDVSTIRRAFRFAEGVSRAGGMLYGVGILFGIATALQGSIDLTTPWLVTTYGLIVLLVASNLYADRWMKKVGAAARASSSEGPSSELEAWRRSRGPILSLCAAVAITLSIVFVMVVKPSFF